MAQVAPFLRCRVVPSSCINVHFRGRMHLSNSLQFKERTVVIAIALKMLFFP